MSEEILINTSPFRESGTESNNQSPYEKTPRKERFLRLIADLKNTKKRLARTSAQNVQVQKETLLRDILPISDGLELALFHSSHEENRRNILQGIKMNLTLLDATKWRSHGV